MRCVAPPDNIDVVFFLQSFNVKSENCRINQFSSYFTHHYDHHYQQNDVPVRVRNPPSQLRILFHIQNLSFLFFHFILHCIHFEHTFNIKNKLARQFTILLLVLKAAAAAALQSLSLFQSSHAQYKCIFLFNQFIFPFHRLIRLSS